MPGRARFSSEDIGSLDNAMNFQRDTGFQPVLEALLLANRVISKFNAARTGWKPVLRLNS
jgi:hypothetical protein